MAELTINEAVETIKKVTSDFKDEMTKKAAADYEKLAKELGTAQAEIEANKKEIALKGATILDLQDFQKNSNQKKVSVQQNAISSKQRIEMILYKMLEDNKDAFLKAGEGDNFLPIKMKASAILSSALSGTAYSTYLPWQPGMEPTDQTRFRSFVSTIQSDFDLVHYPRANNPVGTGSFSNQVEGSDKSQVDRGYTMIDLTLKTFAGYLIVSRQALRNIPFLQTWLPTSMNEQLMDQEDLMFSNALVAAAAGSTTGVTVGTTANIEALVILIKNLIKNKYKPNAIAIDPDAWSKIIVTKAVTSGQYSLPNVVTVDTVGNVRILGIPVYPVNWLTGGRCIVGQWSKTAIVESEALTFRQSDSHASTFTANELTYLLERTEGLAIFRTDAFTTCLITATT